MESIEEVFWLTSEKIFGLFFSALITSTSKFFKTTVFSRVDEGTLALDSAGVVRVSTKKSVIKCFLFMIQALPKFQEAASCSAVRDDLAELGGRWCCQI